MGIFYLTVHSISSSYSHLIWKHYPNATIIISDVAVEAREEGGVSNLLYCGNNKTRDCYNKVAEDRSLTANRVTGDWSNMRQESWKYVDHQSIDPLTVGTETLEHVIYFGH